MKTKPSNFCLFQNTNPCFETQIRVLKHKSVFSKHKYQRTHLENTNFNFKTQISQNTNFKTQIRDLKDEFVFQNTNPCFEIWFSIIKKKNENQNTNFTKHKFQNTNFNDENTNFGKNTNLKYQNTNFTKHKFQNTNSNDENTNFSTNTNLRKNNFDVKTQI